MLKALFVKTKTAPNIAAVLKTIIMVCFVIGQLNSSAHAHGHEHENEPHESYCAFCILTVQDEDIDIDDTDLPDIFDGLTVLLTQKFTFTDRNDCLGFVCFSQYGFHVIGPSYRCLDVPRAPPAA